MLLVLTEKPSASRNFARALGGRTGSFNGEEYTIFALRGHVLELDKDFEHQVEAHLVEKYRSWAIEHLPWNPSEINFKKIVKDGCSEILDELESALVGVDEVVIATDNDPSGEGELLAWEALEHVGWQGSTTRAFFADEAPKSIQSAMRSRTRIASMLEDGDYLKALARERFDFCSMQFVRIATHFAKEHGFGSVVREGRLKSVMVSLVGDQQKAHESYVKKPFFEARFKDENGNVFKREAEDLSSIRFDSAEAVDMSGYFPSRIKQDSSEHKHTAPGKLLDLAGLSAILAKEGFKPKSVLATYQKLYEDQVVSYPRTEDKFITPEQFNELLPLIDKIAALVGVNKTLLSHRVPRKTHVKEGAAHGANRPGPNVPASLEGLAKYGAEAPRIYEVLAKNYLAMLAEDYEYDLIKAHLIEFPEFKSVSRVPTALGFKAVFDSESMANEDEEKISERSFGPSAEPFVYEGANKRPSKPTMKWLNKQLEKYSVGTGATRTSTLADVTQGGDKALLSESRGTLSLTKCGQVSWLLLQNTRIANPEVTESLFLAMDSVGRFERSVDEVVNSITELINCDKLTMEKNAPALINLGLSASPVEIGTCPVCGKPVIERGKLLICSSNKDAKREDGTWHRVSGCGFQIFSEPFFFGKKLTKNACIKALKDGRVLVKGLKSKAGKPYDAFASLSNHPNERGFYFLEHGGFPEKKKTVKRKPARKAG